MDLTNFILEFSLNLTAGSRFCCHSRCSLFLSFISFSISVGKVFRFFPVIDGYVHSTTVDLIVSVNAVIA